MQSIFNLENDFLEQKQLKKDFEADPIATCERLRAVLEQCSVSARAMREVEIREANVQKALEAIAVSADTFAQSVSQRSSMFRGGEESLRAYRALVPFLLALEGRRAAIRTEMRGFLRWRDCLAGLHPLAEELFGGATALIIFAETKHPDLHVAQMIDNLKRDAKNELDAQTQLLERIEENLSVGEQMSTGVIARFLNLVYEASDSEHDGENCHATKVLELIANLKEELKNTSLGRK